MKLLMKLQKVSRTLPQNSYRIVTKETEDIGFDIEIPKERYISRKKT